MTGTGNVAGQSIALGGSGQVDLASGAMSLNMGGSLPDGSMTESEVLVGGKFYLNVSSNGQNLVAAIRGRHWITVPIAQSGARTLATNSPVSSLFLLSQSRTGAKVTSLGPSSIGGQTCNEYAVTPSRQGMLAAARQEYAKLGLSIADTEAALQILQAEQPPTITAWFDLSRELACQVSVDMQFGSPTSASSNAARMVMSFTHYGEPVKITAPAPSDTISLQDLLKAARH
jgi:hypothetical protein